MCPYLVKTAPVVAVTAIVLAFLLVFHEVLNFCLHDGFQVFLHELRDNIFK